MDFCFSHTSSFARGTKNSDQPDENLSKEPNQGKKSCLMASPEQLVKGLILRMYDVLRSDSQVGCHDRVKAEANNEA